MKTQLLLLLVVTLLWSCNKDEDLPAPNNSDTINFTDMQIGQKSTYVSLTGKLDFDSFTYHADTLVLEIVGKDGEQYITKEFITPGSAVRNGGNNPSIAEPEMAYFYYLSNEDNELKVKPINTTRLNSRIFVETSNLLLEQFNNEEVEIKGWKVDLTSCECDSFLFTKNYQLFGQLYDHLNILIDIVSIALDGNGYIFVYDQVDGLVRFSTYSSWNPGEGTGWDLLP